MKKTAKRNLKNIFDEKTTLRKKSVEKR